jgi:phage tail sheath protein FI
LTGGGRPMQIARMTLLFEEGTKPIETVGGDLVAFVGRAAQGPCMDPRLCTSLGQYAQIFGEAGEGYLWHAVQGFFANGGEKCYVVCLDAGGSAPDWIGGLRALGKHADETLSLVAFPGLVDPAQQSAVAKHLDEHRAWFGLLDGPAARPADGLAAVPVPEPTAWAALFYPWVSVHDPVEGAREVPPCGHVAGVVARRQRESGLESSPAGQLVRGVLGVSDRFDEQEAKKHLTPRRVNPILDVKGKGYHLWGEATLAPDERLRALTMARRHLLLLRSIEIGTRWVQKREDKPALRERLREEVETYLERVRVSGALPGADAAAAYAVDAAPRPDDPAGALTFRVSLSAGRGDKIEYVLRQARP